MAVRARGIPDKSLITLQLLIREPILKTYSRFTLPEITRHRMLLVQEDRVNRHQAEKN